MTRRRAGVWIRRTTGILLVAMFGVLIFIGVHRYRILKPQLLRLLPDVLSGGPGKAGGGTAVGVYKGFEHSESLAGKPVFELRAVETLGLVSGWYSLQGVTLKLFRKDGGVAMLRCDRARFNAKTRAAEMQGSVHLELEDGSFVDASTGRFDPHRRFFRSGGEVFFGNRTMLGRAGSLVYDLAHDRIVLEKSVRAFGSGGATLSAPRIVYDRKAFRITLPEGCTITDPTGKIEATRGTVGLSERDEGPDSMVLEDGVRFTRLDPSGEGEVKGHAERLVMQREGPEVWRGRAGTRGPWVELEFVDGPGFLYRRLQTWELEFVVGPEGPRSARSTGMTCLLDLPEDAPARFAESRTGLYHFEGGKFADMELSEAVRITGGPFLATADSARFVASAQTVILQSDEAKSASPVHVVRDGTEVWAREVHLNEGGDGMTARGDVQGRSTRVGFTETKDGAGEVDAMRFAAQTLEASSKTNQVVLRRDARVWQGSRLLLAEEITFDETNRTLDATGNVRMTVPAEEAGIGQESGKDAGSGGGEALIVARLLHYSEADRKAVFQGGVRLSDPAHMLSTSKLTVTIDDSGALEGFEAEGQVVIEEMAIRRRMTGQKARFVRETGDLVVTGEPARLVDEKGNVITSRSLTWHRPDDTVTVAGEDEAPTETIYHPEG